MRTWTSLLVAAPVAAGLLAAPAAHADWRHHRGGWGHHERHHGSRGNGDAVAGALIGLGIGALLGGVIASQAQPYAPPPVVYTPPPAYYPPPAYAVPAYAPPPVYYVRPGY